jgi:hypothetical protein
MLVAHFVREEVKEEESPRHRWYQRRQPKQPAKPSACWSEGYPPLSDEVWAVCFAGAKLRTAHPPTRQQQQQQQQQQQAEAHYSRKAQQFDAERKTAQASDAERRALGAQRRAAQALGAGMKAQQVSVPQMAEEGIAAHVPVAQMQAQMSTERKAQQLQELI